MFKRVIYAESSPLLWERNQGKAKSDFSPFFCAEKIFVASSKRNLNNL